MASAIPLSSGSALCLPVPWQQRCGACFATCVSPFKKSELPVHHSWCLAQTGDEMMQRLLSWGWDAEVRSLSQGRFEKWGKFEGSVCRSSPCPATGAEPCVWVEGPAAVPRRRRCFHSAWEAWRAIAQGKVIFRMGFV